MPMRERNRARGRRPAQATSGTDGFLWGWVHLLSGCLNGPDLLHEEAPDRPGWRGPAVEVDSYARLTTDGPPY